jgi:hypothetical protein
MGGFFKIKLKSRNSISLAGAYYIDEYNTDA